jgi:hypothetical protein
MAIIFFGVGVEPLLMPIKHGLRIVESDFQEQ